MSHCWPLQATVQVWGERSGSYVQVEVLTADAARRITDGGVPSIDDDCHVRSVIGQLQKALNLLDKVATVSSTVCTIVNSLHVIESAGYETDVSFSYPSVPFSVFVSIPPNQSVVTELRLAEAILHEAMHLQLSSDSSSRTFSAAPRKDSLLTLARRAKGL